MPRGPYALAGPVLRLLDPETAHDAAIAALKAGLIWPQKAAALPELRVEVFGLSFANPLGLAAGFDKNAAVVDPLLALGFGFVEAGSVTPKPQAGNPKPRLFRLEEDHGVINRMGFNNLGHAAALASLKRRRRPGIVGVNVGANKDSADRAADYVAGYETFAGVADYIAVNVSSPNTPGLRNLQAKGELEALLARLDEARERLAESGVRRVPLLLKIAPDLSTGELEDVAGVCLESRIDGVIVSNTTITRPATLKSTHRAETGGLSGEPLFELSTRRLAAMYRLVGHKLPLIGVGGVSTAAHAWQKLRAGASLVQLYSGLVYEGPGVVADICEGLGMRLRIAGKRSLTEAVGEGVSQWT